MAETPEVISIFEKGTEKSVPFFWSFFQEAALYG